MRLPRPAIRISRNFVAPVVVSGVTALAVIAGVAVAYVQQGDPRVVDGIVSVQPPAQTATPVVTPTPTPTPVMPPATATSLPPAPTVSTSPTVVPFPTGPAPAPAGPPYAVPSAPGHVVRPPAPSATSTPTTPPAVGGGGTGSGTMTGSTVVPVGRGRRVEASALGLHQGGISTGTAPQTSYGAVRLWDSGTTWRTLEPTDNAWAFGPLDTAVATAKASGAAPLLVLGQTPQFAATSKAAGIYGPGASSMPNLAQWKSYVRTVATRYKGKIREYEVWNEPNVAGFWAGTPAQMVTLAGSARAIIKSIDPGALVTTPGLVVRRPTQRGWLTRYLAAGGGTNSDIINIHLYPDSASDPEDVLTVMSDVRKRLAAAKATQPVWDTEINYGLPTGGQVQTSKLPPAVQAGYVARTFLVAASLGLERTYWYAWDNQGVGVRAVNPDGTRSASGTAFATVYSWLVGHEFRGCSADATGVWSCYVDSDRIVWTTGKSQAMPAPAGTKAAITIAGRSTPVKPGARVVVSASPIKLVGAG